METDINYMNCGSLLFSFASPELLSHDHLIIFAVWRKFRTLHVEYILIFGSEKNNNNKKQHECDYDHWSAQLASRLYSFGND